MKVNVLQVSYEATGICLNWHTVFYSCDFIPTIFSGRFHFLFCTSTHVQPCEVRGTGLLWDAVWTQFTHDVGLLKKKIWPIRLKMRLRLIEKCAWRTRNLLDAADSLDIVDRYSLSWNWFMREEWIFLFCAEKVEGHTQVDGRYMISRIFGIFVFYHQGRQGRSDIGRPGRIGHQPKNNDSGFWK